MLPAFGWCVRTLNLLVAGLKNGSFIMLLVNEGQSCSEKLLADCIAFVLKCVHNCEKPFDSFVLKMQDIVLCGDVCSYVESTGGGTFAHVSEIVHKTFGPAIKG